MNNMKQKSLKQQMMEIAKIKDEAEFYRKYPTEESFMKKYGGEVKKAQQGFKQSGSLYQPYNPFLPGVNELGVDRLSVNKALATKFNAPGFDKGVEDYRKIKPMTLGNTSLGEGSSDEGLGKIGGYVQSGLDVAKGLQMWKDERDKLKKAKQWKKVTDVQLQASQLPPEDIERKYLRPEEITNTGEEFFPIYGAGTNILSVKKGGKIKKANVGTILSSIGEDKLSNIATQLSGGETAGSTIGGTLGQTAGTLLGGPVGGAIGKVAGNVLGNIAYTDPEKTKKYNTQMNMNIAKIAGIPYFRENYKSYMEEGGQLTNPQLITKFGEHSLSELLVPDRMMNTLRTGGNIRQNSGMNGELQTLWGGKMEESSNNPYSESPTYIFKGNTHKESDNKGNTGIGIAFGEAGTSVPNKNVVEVENNEPVEKINGDAVIFGNLSSKYFTDIIPDYKGKTVKSVAREISKDDRKQSNIIKRSLDRVSNLDILTPFDKLTLNSAKANIMGANEKQLKNSMNMQKLASLQEAINKTSEVMGLDAEHLAKGNIKFAKNGVNIKKAENGEYITNPKTGEKFDITSKEKLHPWLEKLYSNTIGLIDYKKPYIGGIAPVPGIKGAATFIPTMERLAKGTEKAAEETRVYSKLLDEISALKSGVNIPKELEGTLKFNSQVPWKTIGAVAGGAGAIGTAGTGLYNLIKKYFPPDQVDNAYKVMMAESSGDPSAVRPESKNPGGGRDSGLFQINSKYHPEVYEKGDPLDPEYNVKAAADIYKKQGWQPWVSAKQLGLVGNKPYSTRDYELRYQEPFEIPEGEPIRRNISETYSPDISNQSRKDYPNILPTKETPPIYLPQKPITPPDLRRKGESSEDKGKKFPWEDVMKMASGLIPYFRPSDVEELDPRQLTGELSALTETEEPVKAQLYHPQLDVPYRISLDEQKNDVIAQTKAAQRMVGNNAAAQAMIAAQSADNLTKIDAEEFRINQEMANKIYSQNRTMMNEAQLQNLNILDQQYQRQALAKSNTKAIKRAALQSIEDKYLQNQLENRGLATYENLYNYRFDDRFRAKNYNPLAQFDVQGNEEGTYPTTNTEDYVYRYEKNPETGEEELVSRRGKRKDEKLNVPKTKNGGIVKFINSL